MVGAYLVVALLAHTVIPPAPPAPPAAAQGESPWTPYFTLRVENDSLPGAGSDDAYTQGLEARIVRRQNWSRLQRWLSAAWGDAANDDVEDWGSLVVGQTMLTPHNIITYAPDPGDRRSAAFFYVGLESSRFRYAEPAQGIRARQLTLGVYGGMIGPLALGRDLQSGFHVLRESRMSKTWLVNQIGNEPQLNIFASSSSVVAGVADNVDLTLTHELSLGTTQTFAATGATVRLGRGLTGLPPGVITYSAVRQHSDPRLGVAFIAGARVRFVGWNAFIQGTLFDRTNLTPARAIVDFHAGGEVRWRGWRASYLVMRRTQEFIPLPGDAPSKHRFVALSLSRQAWPTDGTTEPGRWRRVAEGVRLNLRFGRSGGSVVPQFDADHTPALAAGWGLERSVLGGRFAIGVETTGTTREGGPPPLGSSTHEDLFLLAKAVTVGWEPTRSTSRHKLQLRVGGGKATIKHQVTPDTGSVLEPEPINVVTGGRSVLAGARYLWRVGSPLSLAVDVTAVRLTSSESLIRRARFVAVTFGFQIHPWGRDAGRGGS